MGDDRRRGVRLRTIEVWKSCPLPPPPPPLANSTVRVLPMTMAPASVSRRARVAVIGPDVRECAVRMVLEQRHWLRDSSKTVTGKPGAVQPAEVGIGSDDRKQGHSDAGHDRCSLRFQARAAPAPCTHPELAADDGPSALSDYVVVHELCHLRHMNHSPHFWAMVSGIIPDYRQRRHSLNALQGRLPL